MSSTRSTGKLLPAATRGPAFLPKRVGDGDPRSGVLLVGPSDTQDEVCAAAARLFQSGQPEVSQLDSLLSLDRRAQPVVDRLLTRYVEGDEHSRPFEWTVWQSALRLSQSLFKAYDYLLQHIRSTTDENWAGCADLVLGQLFHHRSVEFLLRFLRYKKRSPELWRELHEILRFAQQRGLLTQSDASSEPAQKRRAAPLQEYLQILLLEAMNCGQFSPREALWAHRWFARWCSGSGLRLVPHNGRVDVQPTGFVVDPCGSDGLKRVVSPGVNLLYLDPSPLRVMIEQEMASLLDNSGATEHVTPAVRAGQLAMLSKLAILFAPNPVRIERRAERKPVDLTVQAIAGLPCIVELFLKNGQKQADGIPSAPVEGSEMTLWPTHDQTLSLRFATGGDPGAVSFSAMGPFEAIAQAWQAKDQSDFGCRMRGQIDDLNRVLPGSLIIVRDGETVPWIVSVVRWFRRLMVDHVEIGVEYLGRNPRLVKVVPGFHHDLAIGNLPDPTSKCFAALFLPPSGQLPTMPIKTLLLPAGEFRAGCDVTLLSSGATYRMRLNEPIQQQFDFVWTSFTVIDTWVSPPLHPE